MAVEADSDIDIRSDCFVVAVAQYNCGKVDYLVVGKN